MELLLPLAAFAADTVANARLVVLWGLSPPSPRLWPSYALLALLLLPHACVALVELLRVLLAAAALPAALRASAPAAPAEQQLAAACGWVMAAPWWAAVPALLLLTGPCLVVLSVALPLTLPLHLLGLTGHGAAQRYVELLQACSAATLAPCSAVILTGLLLAGNSPDTPLLTPTLYWVVLLAAMCDMAAALHLALRRAREERLRDERRRHRLAAAAAGAAATEP
ncbi:hypothetical protein MNEG_16314 [Monoraphidium neglectum]|uniref:Uncharacterized protein n=1 Tax=Monoraphidium neglectum TaxID=145388 RepID=A0A0D2LI23_9CHLO|nr:hypothetical protein MNEG_16314 [Monoraphidium neglectum]KIY91649.1 hypothetical protein MNEG_16314 [Monoraphidium neglectum]|eukprot:XP_013890669.1 hypothetical protein MNEG_16314 [Monoraphidium neglectum]